VSIPKYNYSQSPTQNTGPDGPVGGKSREDGQLALYIHANFLGTHAYMHVCFAG